MPRVLSLVVGIPLLVVAMSLFASLVEGMGERIYEVYVEKVAPWLRLRASSLKHEPTHWRL